MPERWAFDPAGEAGGDGGRLSASVTASFEGETFYWEHLGMLTDPGYVVRWERKKAWYAENGYSPRLVTSEDHPDGGISTPEIEKIARERILEA